ncbi:hypothetical protein PMAYCL1PPCAC_10294, partial [Pristionchus mayeri]
SGMFRFLSLLVLLAIAPILVCSFELTDIPVEARFLFEVKGAYTQTLGKIFTYYGAIGEFKAKSPSLFEKVEKFLSGLNREEATFKQYFANYEALEDIKDKSPLLYQNVEMFTFWRR